MGSGFVFFIRTFIPRIGNPSFVTLIFQILALALLFSNKSYKTLYKGNKIIFYSYLTYVAYSLLFFLLLNNEPGNRITDVVYLGISVIYLIFLHKIDYSITQKLLIAVLILSFLINVSVIYASFSNPNFVIGMRATINFSNTENYSGNPHVYAKNGLTSIIISLLLLFKSNDKKIWQYIIYWICLLVGIAIMLFTLVKTAIIITPFILLLFLITYIPKHNEFEVISNKRKKASQLFKSFLIIIFSFFLFKTEKINQIFESYGNMAITFTTRSINTILGISGNSGGFDESTFMRVQNLTKLKNLFFDNPLYFIFGNGYRYQYVDVPIAEVFQNFGVIGLFLFLIYLFNIYFFSLKNILTSNDLFQIFLSIYIFSTLLSTFTQGRPLDYGFFIHASFYIRFLGVNIFNEKYEITSLS